MPFAVKYKILDIVCVFLVGLWVFLSPLWYSSPITINRKKVGAKVRASRKCLGK